MTTVIAAQPPRYKHDRLDHCPALTSELSSRVSIFDRFFTRLRRPATAPILSRLPSNIQSTRAITELGATKVFHRSASTRLFNIADSIGPSARSDSKTRPEAFHTGAKGQRDLSPTPPKSPHLS